MRCIIYLDWASTIFFIFSKYCLLPAIQTSARLLNCILDNKPFELTCKILLFSAEKAKLN